MGSHAKTSPKLVQFHSTLKPALLKGKVVHSFVSSWLYLYPTKQKIYSTNDCFPMCSTYLRNAFKKCCPLSIILLLLIL
jgi:hypothetical protein